MNLKGKRIILGSGSPRRRELLAGLDIDFVTDTGNTFEEAYSPDTPHRDIPVLMSEGKSHGFHRPLEDNEILITSDTMVLCGDRVLGKPRSREEAVGMLEFLSGRRHEVLTAVTIRTNFREITFKDTTFVTFRSLSPDEIDYYIDTCRPFDKAGAYGVQEWIGYAGLESVEGSFYTVMGFPTHLVYRHLQDFL